MAVSADKISSVFVSESTVRVRENYQLFYIFLLCSIAMSGILCDVYILVVQRDLRREEIRVCDVCACRRSEGSQSKIAAKLLLLSQNFSSDTYPVYCPGNILLSSREPFRSKFDFRCNLKEGASLVA